VGGLAPVRRIEEPRVERHVRDALAVVLRLAEHAINIDVHARREPAADAVQAFIDRIGGAA
jgi:hypothetical protein